MGEADSPEPGAVAEMLASSAPSRRGSACMTCAHSRDLPSAGRLPLMLVSKQLGYANVNITLDTFSHILPGFEHRVVERIGAALFG
jgi:hypothetical protein